MDSLNRPARLNRTLLALAGALLLAGGTFVVLTGLAVIPVLDPASAVLPTAEIGSSWAPYAVVVAVIVGLACLLWLAVQTTHRPRTGIWRLPTADPAAGDTTIDADVAVVPLTQDILSYPGAHSVVASLAGDAADPVLELRIGLELDADLAEIRRRIETHAVPRLCAALGLSELPARVRFHLDATRSRIRAR
ncbi:alkaline shock response membrane anchor protein AmaP [Amycolatopsis mongoliensis]|uniref:Alkaline shock response membrane anchor protein AmaP n=1 Tax=Amycolatopsis mongoliensis TaxID=715475 RepID=A0A9Y2NB64_9PSEU|nr:alkaline shock response membrane anchor protein AmaP [Amycolatopsis sp. 4-36]WIX98141.1 alkaline shock response membrane anchor protein AmaP [Amycolatopsis sp. 4-36]